MPDPVDEFLKSVRGSNPQATAVAEPDDPAVSGFLKSVGKTKTVAKKTTQPPVRQGIVGPGPDSDFEMVPSDSPEERRLLRQSQADSRSLAGQRRDAQLRLQDEKDIEEGRSPPEQNGEDIIKLPGALNEWKHRLVDALDMAKPVTHAWDVADAEGRNPSITEGVKAGLHSAGSFGASVYAPATGGLTAPGIYHATELIGKAIHGVGQGVGYAAAVPQNLLGALQDNDPASQEEKRSFYEGADKTRDLVSTAFDTLAPFAAPSILKRGGELIGKFKEGRATKPVSIDVKPESGPTEYGQGPTKILGEVGKSTKRKVGIDVKPSIPGYDEMSDQERSIASAKARGDVPKNADAIVDDSGTVRVRPVVKTTQGAAPLPTDIATGEPLQRAIPTDEYGQPLGERGPRGNMPLERQAPTDEYGQPLGERGPRVNMPLEKQTPVDEMGQPLGENGPRANMPLEEPGVPELDDNGLIRTRTFSGGRGMRRGGAQSGQALLPDFSKLSLDDLAERLGRASAGVLRPGGGRVDLGASGDAGPAGGAPTTPYTPGKIPGGDFPENTGPGGKASAQFGPGFKSIVDTVNDYGGPAARELSRRLVDGLSKTQTTLADWKYGYDQGWSSLDRASKTFLHKYGTSAVENPDMDIPRGAKEFIQNARKEMKTKANEELFVEDDGKLRSSRIDPVKHVDHVLTDEAVKRYEAGDPATVAAWEKANPGRSYDSWIKSKIKAVPGRYESDWLKSTNRNALPREVNWPEGDLEQNLEKIDQSYMRRMASHQAQMESLGVSNTETGEYTGPKGQGRYGELLAEIKAQHGTEAGTNIEGMVKNAFGRGDTGNTTQEGRFGNKAARWVNGARGLYFFTGNANALHHVVQGGLTAAESLRHPSNFVAMGAKFLKEGVKGTYQEGVKRGSIPRLLRDSPQMEGTDWSGKANWIGRYVNTVSTATYSSVSTAMRTLAYAASENEMSSLSKDLASGGSKAEGALHILDDEMKLYPSEIDEIRRGEPSDATLKKFQRNYVAKATGTAVSGEEANWTHDPKFLTKILSFAQRGAVATTNMTMRGPVEEALNGRPQRLGLALGTAYVASPLVRKGWEKVFGKDKNAPPDLAEIMDEHEQTGDDHKFGLQVLDWWADMTNKSWMLGGIGRRVAGTAHAVAYGAEHNENTVYVVGKALSAILDLGAGVVPTTKAPLYKEYQHLVGDDEPAYNPRGSRGPRRPVGLGTR